ncbi:dTDP-4-dehydrorhamnose reductase [Enterococcus sp. PF1-24]|uniref:SDR family oxidoreductase n=1 Tax=unclassified Enterococcus TaxID=2608891 RepID=UPI002474853F|nr:MULTISPECIES: SDR family oxidoreductase [unclassified Enterococcus]MDH6363304.1 dTDP-4-dehydrorhamnose reductase [Enterococcus sp. PFB1-1]MDH6400395.1 dTDP-4-dehydrorhamnose reductase [Enterococcus sp. PF1-24]
MTNLNIKKKVLLLGAQGNLGSQIKKEFVTNSAYELICWTRKDCDLLDLIVVENKVNELKPAIVINTVAYNNVDVCENNLVEQKLAIKLNVLLPATLAKVCRMINGQLIHFSTNYVFSGEEKTYSESAAVSPINFYGLSKSLGEEAILAEAAEGLKVIILRVANLFGPSGESNNSKASFFAAMNNAAKTRDTLTVVNDEQCCFTYTKDVAKVILQLTEENKFQGIYHLVNSGGAKTWYEASKLFFDYLQKEITLISVNGEALNRSAARPKSAVIVSERAELPVLRDFETALYEYLEEYHEDFK